MREKHAPQQKVIMIEDTDSADEDIVICTTRIPPGTRKRRSPLTSEKRLPQTAGGARNADGAASHVASGKVDVDDQDDDEEDDHGGLTFKRHKLPEPREEDAVARPPVMLPQQMQQVSAENLNKFSSDQLRSMGLSLKPVEELDKILKAASAGTADLEAAVVAKGAACHSYRLQLTFNSTLVHAATGMLKDSVAQTLGDDDTAAGFVTITHELCQKAHEQVKVHEEMLLNSAPYLEMATEHAVLEGSFHRSLGRQEVVSQALYLAQQAAAIVSRPPCDGTVRDVEHSAPGAGGAVEQQQQQQKQQEEDEIAEEDAHCVDDAQCQHAGGARSLLDSVWYRFYKAKQ